MLKPGALDWAALSRLLVRALDLPTPDARRAWLAALPADQAHLRPTLEKLLAFAASPQSDDFLRTLPKFPRRDASRNSDGERIGPYRLIRELGRGGMGVVWLAERADGLFDRPVALKLPHSEWIDNGLAQRVERERDALASLVHPHIAQLYEAGTAADRRPYLALEYVDGMPIDAWCAGSALATRDKVQLFVDVVQAVDFAHARRVIHRDIKPGNVFVTPDGRIKLLDFGIAKLLANDTASATDTALTQLCGRPLTPRYAAPEQIDGLPASVATDLYALGVVLYELLCDRSPYGESAHSRRALENAIVEMTPTRPSRAVHDAATARALRGSLDTIVLKALEKQPQDRYPSTAALGDDLARYLGGEEIDPARRRIGRGHRRAGSGARGHRAPASPTVKRALVAAWSLRDRLAMPRHDARATLPDPAAGDAPPNVVAGFVETLSPLYGRDIELAELLTLTREHRVASIVGAGGIGKTRLARAVAQQLRGDACGETCFVDLAVVASPAHVLPAIATAMRVESPDADIGRHLGAALAERRVLIVFDNCEHVVVEVAQTVQSLLLATRLVKVLATSQEPLRVEGEQVYRLGGLGVPPPAASLAEARGFGALQLLEERARGADQRFALTEETTARAIDICRQLDGVALAIEMAAARIPAFGVDGAHALLDQRLTTLRSPLRTAPSKHETLRATLEWSCGLLNEGARTALWRLSTFCGAFGLATARRVIASDTVDPGLAVEIFSLLVDKSLLQREGRDPPRYRLLDSMRLYAAQQLAQAGDAAQAMQSHCQAMAGIGLEIRAAYFKVPDAELFERFMGSYADLERAFDHACRHHDADAASATLLGLRQLDQLRGEYGAMRERLVAAIALLPNAPPRARGSILSVVASCGWIALGSLRPVDAAREAAAVWRSFGSEPTLLHHALSVYAIELARSGDDAAAHEALASARALGRMLDEPHAELLALLSCACVARYGGEPAASWSLFRRALALARRAGAIRVMGSILCLLADVARRTGDLVAAETIARDAVRELRALDQRLYLATALEQLLRVLAESGDLDGAYAVAPEALRLAWEFERRGELAYGVALLALRSGRNETAALLLGYARAAAHRGPEAWFWESDFAAAQARARTALGAHEVERLLAEGGELSDAATQALIETLLAARRGA